MVIRCKIGTKYITFKSMEKARKFNKYNEITYMDCSKNEIIKIENLPNSLTTLYCDENLEIINIPESLKFLNEKPYVNTKFNDFMEDKISDKQLLTYLYSPMIISKKNWKIKVLCVYLYINMIDKEWL